MAKKHCPHCGAAMVQYPFVLNKGLAACLKRMALQGTGSIEVRSLGLTNSQYTNFPKLAYWGLIDKSETDSGGRGGVWCITEKGWDFVYGQVDLQRKVIVYRNVVQEFSDRRIFIQDICDGWKYKPEYVSDSEPYDPQRPLI